MIALKSRQILTWWLTVVWSVREIEKNKGNYFLIFFMTLLLSFFVSSTNELEKIVQTQRVFVVKVGWMVENKDKVFLMQEK